MYGNILMLREHTHKKLLKFGHYLEGGGSGLAQIAWSTFLLRGKLFEFSLQGATGVLQEYCV